MLRAALNYGIVYTRDEAEEPLFPAFIETNDIKARPQASTLATKAMLFSPVILFGNSLRRFGSWSASMIQAAAHLRALF
jgi:hypothetical protein